MSIDEFGKNRADKSGLTVYCRPCHTAAGAENRRRNHGSERNCLLELRYGVTEERLDQMIDEQGGVRVIRPRAEPKHVDHDHGTGAMRGIACHGCTSGMGRLRDDPIMLRRAADHLTGGLVKTVAIPAGGSRLPFTVPDVDPLTVPPGGWTVHWEADGRHRKENPELGPLRVGPVWAE